MKKLFIIFAVFTILLIGCYKQPLAVQNTSENTTNYIKVNDLKYNVNRSWFISNSEIGSVANDATVLLKLANNDSIPIQIILNGVLYFNPNAAKNITITNQGTTYKIVGNLDMHEYTNDQNKISVSFNFQTTKK